MQIGTSFPLGGGDYDENVPCQRAPIQLLFDHSINLMPTNPHKNYAGAVLSNKKFYKQKGDGEFTYLPYTRDKDDSGGADNPIKYRLEVFADGVKFFTLEKPTASEILHNQLVNMKSMFQVEPNLFLRIERIDRNQPPEPYNYRGGSGSRSYQWVKGGLLGSPWRFCGMNDLSTHIHPY